MTAFWLAALGLRPSSLDPGDDFRVLRGERVHLLLQLSRHVASENRFHLDLYADDKSAEVVRLVALGTDRIRSSSDPSDDYDVLLDPEHNEFCVCQLVEGM